MGLEYRRGTYEALGRLDKEQLGRARVKLIFPKKHSTTLSLIKIITGRCSTPGAVNNATSHHVCENPLSIHSELGGGSSGLFTPVKFSGRGKIADENG